MANFSEILESQMGLEGKYIGHLVEPNRTGH